MPGLPHPPSRDLRGLLLPRMNGVFGRRDWLANGVLFAVYHLHVTWAIPTTLLDTFILAYPSKRYRSALVGIAVHSAQSVFFLGLVLPLESRLSNAPPNRRPVLCAARPAEKARRGED
jgi:hypothetical protein